MNRSGLWQFVPGVMLFCLFIPGISADNTPTPTATPYAAPAAENLEVIESVVAVVNESVITRTELEDKVRREMYLRGSALVNPPASFKRRLLDELIEEEILVQEADRRKVEPSREAVDSMTRRLVNHVRNIFAEQGLFEEHVDSAYIDMSDFHRRMRILEEREYKVNALVSLQFSILEKEVQEYEARLKAEGKPTRQYRLSQILLKRPKNATGADMRKLEEKALGILVEIQGGADFATMVRRHSEEDATRDRGGELGVLDSGAFSREIEKYLDYMNEGETSLPVTTEAGVHLVKLEEVIDARTLLHREKFREARQKLIQELKEAASISILEDNLMK